MNTVNFELYIAEQKKELVKKHKKEQQEQITAWEKVEQENRHFRENQRLDYERFILEGIKTRMMN